MRHRAFRFLGGAFLGMAMPENGDAARRFAHCWVWKIVCVRLACRMLLRDNATATPAAEGRGVEALCNDARHAHACRGAAAHAPRVV